MTRNEAKRGRPRTPLWLGLVGIPLVMGACGRTEAAGPGPGDGHQTPPAKVVPGTPGARPVLELSPEAVRRLGIETAPVERIDAQRVELVPGELRLPSDARIELRAPCAGILRTTDRPLVAGLRVRAGEALFLLEPYFSPESERTAAFQRAQLEQAANQLALARAENAGALERARARVTAARAAHERARALVEAQAGSLRASEEAEAELLAAEAELRSLEGARAVLDTWRPVESRTEPEALSLVAPRDGVLMELRAAPGEILTAGDTLLVLEDRRRLWLRVPVRESQLPRVPVRSVRLAGTDWTVGTDARVATPIEAPASAEFASETVDLWFALDDPEGSLRPAQRVGVELPRAEREPRLVVPFAAVLFDAQGAAWVYVRTEATHYQRQPVDFERSEGPRALLRHGPELGSEVVVAGAAELFGTEFGTGK